MRQNRNPIEKAERSALLLATTVHRAPAAALLKEDAVARVAEASPRLFPAIEPAP